MNKLNVKSQDPEAEAHPHCAHGPTLLFYNGEDFDGGYYSCAAHRNKSGCSFRMSVKDYKASATTNQNFQKYKIKEIDKLTQNAPFYCLNCNKKISDTKRGAHDHHKVIVLNEHLIKDPTQFLPPLDNDEEHAQYFFDQKALNLFERIFKSLEIRKVVCIGAPRLHGHLRTHCPSIKSYLLDFDERFMAFFDSDQYAWYNMCNNHFFFEEQREYFEKFVKCETSENLLLFTDPPFACRTEPIANTLNELTRIINNINKRPHQPLPIFWIFPYYFAHYIQKVMPEMEMCDYKINYTNHSTYTDFGKMSRKLGSPVRLYTNMPLNVIQLPTEESYKYCVSCARFTASENLHCAQCKICPSKNGSTYRHCKSCGICVKPNYVHCFVCRRCTQNIKHDCAVYTSLQRCWICNQVGHTELKCEAWQKFTLSNPTLTSFLRRARASKIIVCLFCGNSKHNERHCPHRRKYILERTFLGITDSSLKC